MSTYHKFHHRIEQKAKARAFSFCILNFDLSRSLNMQTLASLCRGRWLLTALKSRQKTVGEIGIKVTCDYELSPTRLRGSPLDRGSRVLEQIVSSLINHNLSATFFGSKLQIFDKGENRYVLLRNTICAELASLAQTKWLLGKAL